MKLRFEEIRKKLSGLDCRECGFNSCDDMAKAIVEGKVKLEDCVVLAAGKRVVLRVDGSEIPMGGFVQSFVKNTTLGMVKTLKKVDMKPGSLVELRFLVTEDDLR
jgi:molybdopterin-guanine dinucleotide biosynthesis protein B